MFSCKKTIANLAVAGWMFGSVALVAQTTSANLKAPETAVETPKAADTPNPADTGKLPQIVSSEYIVGESDVLRVNVWKEPEVSQTVVVRTDGNISLPLINEIKVSGMTPLQIQNMVAEKLKGFLNNPQVTVTVTDIRSKRAFITGEVARPGGYSLNAQTTVLQLIAQAGGFTPFAKRDSIVVLRTENGKPARLKFKYKQVVQGKKTEQNISLHPGDTVVVP
ncbi:MAG TPA: polysaccharide biosynthesis/export family protein [Candidatus Sulfotelmatobacter sp.]|nr:polysaccharide biosynthesis/export family protein [Candidatus Sulfotelmatobacter sp.]